MPELEWTIDKKKLEKIMSAIADLSAKQRGRVLVKMMEEGARVVKERLKSNLSNRILKVRTGHLRSSIGQKVIDSGGDIAAVIGSGVQTGARLIYANIHETGGTITPKNVRWLTIPLAAAKTPSGVLRKTARQWDNTFFAKNILFQKRGKKAVPLFALKKSVKIPARRYMSRSLAQAKSQVDKIMLKTIEEQLRRVE